jgi:hypothetical protein
VPACGGCTNNADCCPGTSCILGAGNAQGICGPCGGGGSSSSGGATSSSGGSASSGSGSSSGGSCALYGQLCTTAADCCNSVPCSGGHCVVF